MRMFKKIFIVALVLGVLGTAGTALAASSLNPVENKTFALMADEDGKLEDFWDEMLEHKKEILDQRVKEGILTQEEADEIYKSIIDNQDSYNSSAYIGRGRGYGSCCGRGYGMGLGQGRGMGYGWRR